MAVLLSIPHAAHTQRVLESGALAALVRRAAAGPEAGEPRDARQYARQALARILDATGAELDLRIDVVRARLAEGDSAAALSAELAAVFAAVAAAQEQAETAARQQRRLHAAEAAAAAADDTDMDNDELGPWPATVGDGDGPLLGELADLDLDGPVN